MPSCCVPECTNGYNKVVKKLKAEGKKNPSFFKIKESQVKRFNALLKRKDRKLTTEDYVCSDHFRECDIIRKSEAVVVNGKVVLESEVLRCPRLKEDAVPFVRKSDHEGKTIRKPPKERIPPPDTNGVKRQHANEKPGPPQKKLRGTEKAATSSSTPEVAVIQDFPAQSTQIELEENVVPHQPLGHNPNPEENTTQNDSQPPDPFIKPTSVTFTGDGWGVHMYPEVHFYIKVDIHGNMTHCIKIMKDQTVEVKVGNHLVPMQEVPKTITTITDIETVISAANTLKPCEGNGFGGFSSRCQGGIRKGLRCRNCRESRKNERKKSKRQASFKKKLKRIKHSKIIHKSKKQIKHLRAKVKSLQKELREAYMQCRKIKEKAVEEAIKDLPDIQQVAVRTCLQAAKKKGPRGNRYFKEWIYESMLMRIKGPKLYEHIREKKILPLPSRTRLNHYMCKLHPTYGYQSTLFQVLKQKVSAWDEKDRHGSIMIDEMKLEEGVTFDRHTLKTTGFVDLGEHTPKHQENKMGDHALVVLFQPARGKWVQTLGCFLSKGNAKGDVLSKLLLEGVALAESSGLMVDSIVTDGASWNRNMWSKFGIGEETSSCEHPFNEDRKLWFISDWCHLIKCARNMICPLIPNKPRKPKSKGKKRKRTENNDPEKEKEAEEAAAKEAEEDYKRKVHEAFNKEIEVPEGIVKRQHWITLLNQEKTMANHYGLASLTYVPKLTDKHIFPDGFERMNVKLAYQFFSNSVAAGMEWYRKRGTSGLEDSEATECFLRRFNRVADSMNSNSSLDALRKDAKHENEIKEFLEYYKECVQIAKRKGHKAFLSESTDLGILVTLRSILELSSYLIDEVGYQYVMTARFNQDAIEQFFGNIRRSSGPNPHPDPKLFAQLYRLLSVYSLVQPPKGSNVSGVGNMNALINADDKVAEAEKHRKEAIDEILDEVVTNGEAFESLPLVHQMDHMYFPRAPQMEENMVKFMAGFTASRRRIVTENCEDCILTLTQFREEAGPSHEFSKIKEMYGGYTYASEELAKLIGSVEKAVQECLHTHDVHDDMFITVLKFVKINPQELVGCVAHMYEVTKKIVKFYLTMRMFFAADRKNLQVEAARRKKKAACKQYKL